MTSKTSMMSLGSVMRRGVVGAAMLALTLAAGAANAKPKPAKSKSDKTPIKLYMSPASTVPSADIVKNLMYKCPNVTVTLNSKESDYMLEARGWPEHYRFTLFRKGGDAAFATTTVLLSNAVKDVCKYVNTYPVPAESAPAKDGSSKPKPFKPSSKPAQ
jgi:hypothetical protein